VTRRSEDAVTVRHPRLLLALAVPGIVVCVFSLALFVYRFANKGLNWTPEHQARDFYLAVGRGFGQGFAAGFFLCLFLVLAGIGLETWLAGRRGRP
jgi:hypothetical protein